MFTMTATNVKVVFVSVVGEWFLTGIDGNGRRIYENYRNTDLIRKILRNEMQSAINCN